MNKFLKAGILVASSVFGSQAMAADMDCYVDTQAYDQYTPGYCFAMVWGANKATAVYRVTASSKSIDSIIWGGVASGCNSSRTSCSVSIRPFRENKATATILYSDGTWGSASATASFEDGR